MTLDTRKESAFWTCPRCAQLVSANVTKCPACCYRRGLGWFNDALNWDFVSLLLVLILCACFIVALYAIL